jgi:microcystin-dependent protein
MTLQTHRRLIRVLILLGAVGPFAIAAPAAITGSTGSGNPLANMQPSLGLNYIISLTGVYPSQNPGAGGGSGFEPFLGEVALFAGPFAPKGWTFADGRLLAKNQNQALFSLLGTTYGGNGTTTFALPDLRGRVPIGIGQGPGLTNRQLGQQLGTETVVLTEAQLPSHAHTLPTGGATAPTGNALPFDNMQPSLGINYIIAEEGIFPRRGGAGSTGGVDPFIGEIIMFAGSFAPTGWSFANGATRPNTQNPALAAILGTNFGGNASTYALPDLRGRTAVGTGIGPGLTEFDVGDALGAENVALTAAQLPSHAHSLTAGGSTGTTGSGAVHENQQPSLAISYIIALDGVFPQPSGAGGGSGLDPYIGEIALFAGTYAPLGWAFAQGQLMSIAEYGALYELIGTTYGGDGQSTFALPDLSGRAPMGVGQGSGRSDRQLGEMAGAASITISVGQMAPHAHTFSSPLPGDYNQNGSVDAADFTIWRDHLGQSFTLPNVNPAAETLGLVDAEDYAFWKSHFGDPDGSGSGATAWPIVPEPTTSALLIIAAAGWFLRRGRTT